MTIAGAGHAGVSEGLRQFVAELPYERGPLLDFAVRVAGEIEEGERLLDVGAGDAPYRELFAHVEYLTNDWEDSSHDGARTADVVSDAVSLPLEDGSFTAALLMQVLEHLPEPSAVLREIHRILRPGGVLYLTAPLVWELHERPHDYYRYTSDGLEHLLCAAGYEAIEVTPRNDCFTTVAQLMRNLDHVMGRAPDGLDDQRVEAAIALRGLADEVAALAPLDSAWTLPLGYMVKARVPIESRAL